jgi:hypothetical protein
MKKYTNKILIITLAVFLAVTTIQFFISAYGIKKLIKQTEINK